jgi:hypothetical protein
MVGSEDPLIFAGAYPEQFYDNDYAELLRDARGSVLDAATQMPPHLAGMNRIVDSQDVEYTPQPARLVPGSARWTPLEQERAREERCRQVRKLEHDIGLNESAAMARLATRFAEQDAKIDAANASIAAARAEHEAQFRAPRERQQRLAQRLDGNDEDDAAAEALPGRGPSRAAQSRQGQQQGQQQRGARGAVQNRPDADERPRMLAVNARSRRARRRAPLRRRKSSRRARAARSKADGEQSSAPRQALHPPFPRVPGG